MTKILRARMPGCSLAEGRPNEWGYRWSMGLTRLAANGIAR
jgi:hypothetical protein